MIVICGDTETIQNRDFGFSHEIRREVAESIDYADLADIVPAAVEFEVGGDYRDWNGGKYSNQAPAYGYKTYGLVCFQSDAEAKAAGAISDALDGLIRARCEDIHNQTSDDE